MTDTDTLNRLADDLWQARLDGTTIAPERADAIASLEDAYVVQARQVSAAGLPLAGWKLGATAAAALEAMGLDEPFVAPLLERFTLANGGPVPLFPAHGPKVETEFAIRLGADLPPRDTPYARADIANATAAVGGAFEVIGSRFGPMVPKAGRRTIADGGLNGAILVGPLKEGWREADPAAQRVTVRRNGEVAAADCTTAVGLWPDPLEAAAWLANHARLGTRGLKAGDLLMTGTFAPLIDVAPGDSLTADFGAFGKVEVAFTAG